VEAPSGERLRGKRQVWCLLQVNCVIMPEHFKVVCIPCKALYKCSALPFYLSQCNNSNKYC